MKQKEEKKENAGNMCKKTFLERQADMINARWLAESSKMQISELKAIEEERKKKDVGAATLPEFLVMLKRKFGNIPRAWRFHLDVDGHSAAEKISRASMGCCAKAIGSQCRPVS